MLNSAQKARLKICGIRFPYSKTKPWNSFIDANVDGAGSNREPLSQRKEMKMHQGAITHEMCCLSPQYCKSQNSMVFKIKK